MNLITASIFDLDGTLVDSSAGIEYAIRAAVANVIPGYELPPLRPLIGPRIRDLLHLALGPLENSVMDALEHQYRYYYDHFSWKQAVAYPGVELALAELVKRDIQCFVVTNKPRLPTKQLLVYLQLDRYIVEAVSPDTQSPPFGSKSDSVAFLMKKYRLAPYQTMLIGDATDDARAARICGIRFIAASYGYGDAHTQPIEPKDFVLNNISELLDVIA